MEKDKKDSTSIKEDVAVRMPDKSELLLFSQQRRQSY